MPGIIFEGADASGKSTLARKVADASGRELYLAGGKPNSDAEMWQMISDQEQALRRGALVDRVSSISQQVYREGLFLRQDLLMEVDKLLDQGHLLVYCRPPDHIMLDPKYHVWKEYDTEDWKRTVLENQVTFMTRYDLLMAGFDCIIYDWTSEESRHIEELLKEIHVDGVIDGLRDMARRVNR